MNTTTRLALVCSLAGACALALFPRAAVARDDGSRPGDETLSCDDIYAQGMAIVRVEQEQRDATQGRMKAQVKATEALLVAGSTVGQLDPTHASAIAADAAARATQHSQTELAAQAAASTPDVRKERLRSLWTQKHCQKN